MKLGIDVGSTTIKCVVLDDDNKVIFNTYRRHYSHVKENTMKILKELVADKTIDRKLTVAVSGSAGMGLADMLNIPFVQEVYATKVAANTYIPGTDVVIELGGEDAKILFLTNGVEVRMNGTCAGGTGAFIDQMASLLQVPVEDMNDLAKNATKTYSIASRCGVFAKSDVQPLLNEGAKKSDISKSIFDSVVNQTIGGLAQGRAIKGKIVYLGGPLTFISELRESFDKGLGLKGISPEYSLYYVSMGTAIASKKERNLNELIFNILTHKATGLYDFKEPLFTSQEELDEFRERHAKAKVNIVPYEKYDGRLFLGIDSGSTTMKVVLIDENEAIRYEKYLSNKGNPIKILSGIMREIYEKFPDAHIVRSASTGYGEELIKQAFNLTGGLVETMAHLKAAQNFEPDVNFIIDIGGQDIKCFKIEDGIISDIFLNESCSSGCGSFLQTFANALEYDIADFAKIGLLAKKPVDLGSRCTVFMNSLVKQAQKDGATIEDISAGLSISVVKNALYKVIRVVDPKQLGNRIVVQGGTFYNEAVLRAFERELKTEVVRPNIAGLMGAYGAALYAKNRLKGEDIKIIDVKGLDEFKIDTRSVQCGLCENKCALTINKFPNGRKYISGNQCEKPLKHKNELKNMNLYQSIRDKLSSYKPVKGKRGKIGIPLALNMYEQLPFWYTLFTDLGFEVVNDGFSTTESFVKGQHTIPSDTICFPAKLAHGSMFNLLEQNVDAVWYPCQTYNIDEKKGMNHYNCPIVAYYPESIKNNVEALNKTKFIYDYLKIDNSSTFKIQFLKILKREFGNDFKKKEVVSAIDKAYAEYSAYLKWIRDEGLDIIKRSRLASIPIIVLAGRPYHVDPLVSHNIDKIINEYGASVVTESSIAYLNPKFEPNVLNQWTYHARIYDAAKEIGNQPDINLIQLVSFGCGLDAITTDETKEILEKEHKIYTQIKIDEVQNQGAVRIRIRSLFDALEEGK